MASEIEKAADSPGWTRDTPWRQGTFLPIESKLGIAQSDIVVVASHDCDCVNDIAKEPNIEVIWGKLIEAPSADFTHAKNVRALHLPILVDGQPRHLEIKIADRKEISKSHLIGLHPNPAVTMSEQQKRTLAMWLAARYQRTAFPEALAQSVWRQLLFPVNDNHNSR